MSEGCWRVAWVTEWGRSRCQRNRKLRSARWPSTVAFTKSGTLPCRVRSSPTHITGLLCNLYGVMNISYILKDILRIEEEGWSSKNKRHYSKIRQRCSVGSTHEDLSSLWNMLWTSVELCLEQMTTKFCLYAFWTLCFITALSFCFLWPSTFLQLPLGSHEPSTKHLTIGLEKMTQSLSLKCQLSPLHSRSKLTHKDHI